MKIRLFIVLSIIALSSQGIGLTFKQVGYITRGMGWSRGYIKGVDANHDGYEDLIFTTTFAPGDSWRIAFYSYRDFNRFLLNDSLHFPPSLFWDIGDLDGDSLLDMVTQRWDSAGVGKIGYQIYEPFDYWSFPKIPVWSWRYEWVGNTAEAMYITDLDRDGQKEFITKDNQVIYIFENRGNNQYQRVFSDTLPGSLYVPTPPFAFGDFDGDGLVEFVTGVVSPPPSCYLYECTGDDQYQVTWTDTINAWNMNDAITGPDLDGDGRLEFIFGDNHRGVSGWTGGLWVYEAIGNNQYELIYTDSMTGLSDRGVYAVHSDCGDVDRDGRPELMWAIDRDWMVYKSPGNNMFQRVFSAYGDNGHNSTNVHIHDMNGNGYPEIIESGGNETHIWEVEACRVVYPNGGETLYGDSLAVIRWRNVDPFRADSFSLFYSSDSGMTFSPVAHGIAGNDSAYTWTVPKTFSDDCFVMLWAYQNATGWDFSDSPFRIRDGTGVEAFPPHASRLTPYVPCPNPFVSYATVPGHEAESFALYDVSGRKVGSYKGDRIGWDVSPGIYFLRPDHRTPTPDPRILRIVKLR